MYRLGLVTTIGVLLLFMLPVGAAPLDALFHNDMSSFTKMEDMSLNGPFLGIVARQKAYWALRYPSERQLVVTGKEVNADPQDVNIGGLTVQPGARLPLSLREIIITGHDTERITVLSKRRGQ